MSFWSLLAGAGFEVELLCSSVFSMVALPLASEERLFAYIRSLSGPLPVELALLPFISEIVPSLGSIA